MSTYLYLTCLDHDPPLRAESESGQHLCDLPAIRADVTRNRDSLVRLWDEGCLNPYGAPFRANSARFLAQHRTCRIGIVDEYGETYPALEES